MVNSGTITGIRAIRVSFIGGIWEGVSVVGKVVGNDKGTSVGIGT